MKVNLEIRDIMIGDWVDVRNDASPNQPHIERITPAHLLRDEYWYSIELTPKILEKNEFTCDNNIATLIVRDDSKNISWKCKYCFFTSMIELKNEITGEKVKALGYSVHELQHILRIVGISKEIIL